MSRLSPVERLARYGPTIGDRVRLGDTEITFSDERPRPKGTDARAEPPAPAEEGPPSRYIVQHVDDVAKSYSFDITDALARDFESDNNRFK